MDTVWSTLLRGEFVLRLFYIVFYRRVLVLRCFTSLLGDERGVNIIHVVYIRGIEHKHVHQWLRSKIL